MISLKNLNKVTNKGIKKGLAEIGDLFVNTAKKSITNSPSRTGRIYKYQGSPYQASAPYEIPANVSGANMKSITSRPFGSKKLYFGATSKYSRFLEDGTRRMKPRPFAIRAIKNSRAKAKKILRKNISRQIKNG
jgi:HK97 gp10 family phage protein